MLAKDPSPALQARLKTIGRAAKVLDRIARATPRARAREDAAPERIGVLMLGGIGDAVLMLPLLRALRSRWPQSQLIAIGKEMLIPLFDGEGLIDALLPLDPPWHLPRRRYRLWDPAWRRFWQQMRLARATPVSLLVSARCDPVENLLARFFQTGRFAGFAAAGGQDWVDLDFALSAAQFHSLYRGRVAARAARLLTGFDGDGLPRFPSAAGHVPRRLDDLGEVEPPRVIAAFGANHPLRRLPFEKIRAIVAGIEATGAQLILIDDGETPLPVPERGRVFRGPLDGLKRLMNQGDLFVGTDSGPLQLAVAMGLPVVSLFGPGEVSWAAAEGPAHTAIRVEPMACRPCFDACIHRRPLCLDGLEAFQVLAAVRAALSRLAGSGG